MEIHVRFFAAAREAAARETERIELEGAADVGALARELERRYPALAGLDLRFAVGGRFAPAATALAHGDEVALVPPVSGG